MHAAQTGFEALLERHLLAFADHGAEFYAGSGDDPRRALDLARVNVANRPTLRAFEQAHDIAVNAGDREAASQILAEATMRWESATAFRSSRLAKSYSEERRRTNRMIINRRDFIAGATLVFIAPAIRLLPSQQPSSAADQSRVVFMIRGWSVQDDPASADQAWVTVSNSWRAAWR